MKMIFLVISLAVLAAVLYFYLASGTGQGQLAPTPESVVQQVPSTPKTAPAPSHIPYDAQIKAAEGVSDQVKRVQEAQDEQIRRSLGEEP